MFGRQGLGRGGGGGGGGGKLFSMFQNSGTVCHDFRQLPEWSYFVWIFWGILKFWLCVLSLSARVLIIDDNN